jgi:hypothetical protein
VWAASIDQIDAIVGLVARFNRVCQGSERDVPKWGL